MHTSNNSSNNASPKQITNWKDKKVAVLGLGIEGLASAQFLSKKGAKIWLLEKRKKDDIDQNILTVAQGLNVEFVLGEKYLENLSQYDYIVRSPGVKRNIKELLEAEGKGVIITSHIRLFFDLCPCPIIGVTGTKGKGTTTSLIYEMLKKQGYDAYIGGNIGVAPLEFLEKLTTESWVVLELSSFQLQDLKKSPHIAVMLMVTSEHLDYHADILEYIDAKRNILRFQTTGDFAILNREYPASLESDIHTEGMIFTVSREQEVGEGCFVKDGKVIVQIVDHLDAGPADLHPHPASSRTTFTTGTRRGTPALVTPSFSTKEIIDTKEILLRGKHNLENVCAAVMAATLAGISKPHIVSVLKTFKGLEHRLELIREVNGVKYYDDSFSTTPETAIVAIEAFESPEVLILGGSSKHSDFRELGEVIGKTKNIKAIIGIGLEWERIKVSIGSLNPDILVLEGAKDMKTIVTAASKIAQPGDVVLLTPACASFDIFKNYKDRGEQFKREVQQLE